MAESSSLTPHKKRSTRTAEGLRHRNAEVLAFVQTSSVDESQIPDTLSLTPNQRKMTAYLLKFKAAGQEPNAPTMARDLSISADVAMGWMRVCGFQGKREKIQKSVTRQLSNNNPSDKSAFPISALIRFTFIEYPAMSNTKIADLFGVSRNLVWNVRKKNSGADIQKTVAREMLEIVHAAVRRKNERDAPRSDDVDRPLSLSEKIRLASREFPEKGPTWIANLLGVNRSTVYDAIGPAITVLGPREEHALEEIRSAARKMNELENIAGQRGQLTNLMGRAEISIARLTAANRSELESKVAAVKAAFDLQIGGAHHYIGSLGERSVAAVKPYISRGRERLREIPRLKLEINVKQRQRQLKKLGRRAEVSVLRQANKQKFEVMSTNTTMMNAMDAQIAGARHHLEASGRLTSRLLKSHLHEKKKKLSRRERRLKIVREAITDRKKTENQVDVISPQSTFAHVQDTSVNLANVMKRVHAALVAHVRTSRGLLQGIDARWEAAEKLLHARIKEVAPVANDRGQDVRTQQDSVQAAREMDVAQEATRIQRRALEEREQKILSDPQAEPLVAVVEKITTILDSGGEDEVKIPVRKVEHIGSLMIDLRKRANAAPPEANLLVVYQLNPLLRYTEMHNIANQMIDALGAMARKALSSENPTGDWRWDRFLSNMKHVAANVTGHIYSDAVRDKVAATFEMIDASLPHSPERLKNSSALTIEAG
jgi:hypothetical protein